LACAVGVIDLAGLYDLDGPELVDVAQADTVRGCDVSELVRVKYDAKQNSNEELKTLSLLVAKT
jgi:hypothetical protein